MTKAPKKRTKKVGKRRLSWLDPMTVTCAHDTCERQTIISGARWAEFNRYEMRGGTRLVWRNFSLICAACGSALFKLEG